MELVEAASRSPCLDCILRRGGSPQADLEGLTVLFLSSKKIMSPEDGAVSVPVYSVWC